MFAVMFMIQPKAIRKAEYLEEEGIIVIADSIIKDAQAADLLPVEQRVKEIATMLKVFHFPDHETVLTPWRVVNMAPRYPMLRVVDALYLAPVWEALSSPSISESRSWKSKLLLI